MNSIDHTTATLRFGTVSVEVERIQDATLFTSTATHVTDPADPDHPFEVFFTGTHDDGAHYCDVQLMITKHGTSVTCFPTYIAGAIGRAVTEQGTLGELFGAPEMLGRDQLAAFRM